METVFDTGSLPRPRRFQEWQAAICDLYAHVDVASDRQENWDGYVREAHFGSLTLTDTLLSRQVISRRRRHLARLDNDNYFLTIPQNGSIVCVQGGSDVMVNCGLAGLFTVAEEYDLHYASKVRAYYVELSREDFAARFSAKDRPPLTTTLNIGTGLGRIVAELCALLSAEAPRLDAVQRERLGQQFMDVLALAIQSRRSDEPVGDHLVQQARLRSIKDYIERHLANPNLSLASIARNNGISLRYLHHLFRAGHESAAEWIWHRRLQRCYDMLASPDFAHLSITEIAYSMGFSSSSHFSNLFRSTFGIRPSDARHARRRPI
ncbi:helix-turn-helix domain-containing protein [Rhodoligotrophos defluvii]|uniref:helix-turn-helix domain-containing protein n=1 Tax=Rhodoligotrophos defluvii TaxID=2561934 RepID=UPI0010C9C6D2|nr:helix-turn-helix domain-containing protein [Rhodoligotrophos defluvii]